MIKIALLCAAGMSTSILVQKMKIAAEEMKLSCEINAYPVANAEEVGKNADVILLGPQVRFELKKTKSLCPNRPVDVIDMMAYGSMNGKKVIEQAMNVLGC